MPFQFTKCEGLANDFVVFDARSWPTDRLARIDAARVRQICTRRTGIGADGILILTHSSTADAEMHVVNADGSPAERCGNGIRCVAIVLRPQRDRPLVLDCGGDQVAIRFIDGMPSVDMGIAQVSGELELELDGDRRTWRGRHVTVGNPHFVMFGRWAVDDARKFGPRLEAHGHFSAGANVSFAAVEQPDRIRLTVWERGAGLTRACGTGACATAAAHFAGSTAPISEVEIIQAGGALYVTNREGHVWMRGPASVVYRGTLT